MVKRTKHKNKIQHIDSNSFENRTGQKNQRHHKFFKHSIISKYRKRSQRDSTRRKIDLSCVKPDLLPTGPHPHFCHFFQKALDDDLVCMNEMGHWWNKGKG
jgi:hypothetical protein